MNCQQFRQNVSAMIDGQIVEQDRRDLERHIADCASCAALRSDYQTLRGELLESRPSPVPMMLEWRLRSMASRQAAYRRRFAGLTGWLRESPFRLRASQIMRPLAVPAMAGLFYTVLVFGLFLANFRVIVSAHPQDVPTALVTNAELVSSPPLTVDSEYVVVDVLVDEQGRFLDYRFPEGFGALKSSEQRQRLEKTLRNSVFHPATYFFHPAQGWVRVHFSTQRCEMDVRG